MKKTTIALVLLALSVALPACAPGSGALLYCIAVDHIPNKKCQ